MTNAISKSTNWQVSAVYTTAKWKVLVRHKQGSIQKFSVPVR